MGFCTDEEYQRVPALVPGVRADARPLRHHPAEVLVLGQRRGAGATLPGARATTRRGAGSSARWTSSRASDGWSTRGPRTRCSRTRTSSRRRGTSCEADDKRRARLNCIAHLLSMVPYEDATPPPLKLPPRQPGRGLRAPADDRPELRPADLLTVPQLPGDFAVSLPDGLQLRSARASRAQRRSSRSSTSCTTTRRRPTDTPTRRLPRSCARRGGWCSSPSEARRWSARSICSSSRIPHSRRAPVGRPRELRRRHGAPRPRHRRCDARGGGVAGP